MLKSEFMDGLSTMESPEINEFSPDENNGLLQTCWVIKDAENPNNKFCTPSVRLTLNEYHRDRVHHFYSRESQYRHMYHMWLDEFKDKRE